MKFSDEQKLIVTLLTGIHAHLEVDDGLHPDFIEDAVNSGRTWALSLRYPMIFESRELPPKVRNVMNILEMWDRLEESYQTLSPENKANLVELTIFARNGVTFPGFDGNNEEEYGIARVLIQDLGRWVRFADYDLNSHMPMMDSYSRMLEVMPKLNAEQNYAISVGDLAEVLNAQIHPANR